MGKDQNKRDPVDPESVLEKCTLKMRSLSGNKTAPNNAHDMCEQSSNRERSHTFSNAAAVKNVGFVKLI